MTQEGGKSFRRMTLTGQQNEGGEERMVEERRGWWRTPGSWIEVDRENTRRVQRSNTQGRCT